LPGGIDSDGESLRDFSGAMPARLIAVQKPAAEVIFFAGKEFGEGRREKKPRGDPSYTQKAGALAFRS